MHVRCIQTTVNAFKMLQLHMEQSGVVMLVWQLAACTHLQASIISRYATAVLAVCHMRDALQWS